MSGVAQDTVKFKDQAQYTKLVRTVLQEQESDLESLLLVSPLIQKWQKESVE